MLAIIFLVNFVYSIDFSKLEPETHFKLDIKTAQNTKDLFARTTKGIKYFIPAKTSLEIKEAKVVKWYKIFSPEVIYIKEYHTRIENNILKILAPIPYYNAPKENLPSTGSLKGSETFTIFSDLNVPVYQVSYQGKLFWIEADFLSTKIKFTNEFYEKIPISIVSKIKDKIIVSKNIDHLMYTSTPYGILVSKNAKQWYRIKNLKKIKQHIALTQEACLIVNTLYSCDFGKSFKELFPSYAKQKGYELRELLYSPNGNNLIFMTFQSKYIKKTFVYNPTKKLWKKLFPKPLYTFSPVSIRQIVKALQVEIKQKYKILSINYASNKNKLYTAFKVKINKNIYTLVKVFVFNKSWQESREFKLI